MGENPEITSKDYLSLLWGGASPSTSFDCSGYVSWVVNHCGVGWNFGRLTADGLLGVCTPISSADARPGDLIFFQGTYNTSGASHVGIYVGNGMMIHCGDVRPDRTEVEVDERGID
ncbi:C40 family peptidase [Enterocloster clostridioformis]